jgi:hypothetical protein
MKEPKKRYPTNSIVGLPKTLEISDKDKICNILRKQNPYIAQCLASESSLFDIISVRHFPSGDNVDRLLSGKAMKSDGL